MNILIECFYEIKILKKTLFKFRAFMLPTRNKIINEDIELKRITHTHTFLGLLKI